MINKRQKKVIRRVKRLMAILFTFSAIQFYAQTIVTVAGNGSPGYSGDGNLASSAQVNLPTSVCRDIYGNLYIADRYNHRIRKVSATTGHISTYAGTGTSGFSGDGNAAVTAQLNQPIGVVMSANGTLYISDNANHRIRKVDPSGVITTYAGSGTSGFSGDNGPALNAKLNTPWGITLDKTGNLYIADRNNNRVRVVDTSGVIYTVAGTGVAGYSGNNGFATSANFNKPISVAVDTLYQLYIADEDNHRVRKVHLGTGIVTKIAGTGTAGYNGDGMNAGSADLNFPCGVAVDLNGNVYISDRMNHRLRKINTAGTISTIAGNGSVGFSGDGGNAVSAQINYPRELFSDGSGNIYFADTDNDRIRKITYCNLPDVPLVNVSNSVVCQGDSVVLSISSGNLNAALNWEWYNGSCGQGHIGTGSSITVWPSANTQYYVRGEGGCVTPYGCASAYVQVNSVPLQPDSVSGASTVCNGATYTYSVNPVPGASGYLWNFPANWQGSSLTNNINTVAGSLGGVVYVAAVNVCGMGPAQTFTVNSITVDTTVSIIGNTLQSNAAPASYQWYNCLTDMIIFGETASSYTPMWNGAYSVIVNQYGCIDTSSCKIISSIGISDQNLITEINIVPNPVIHDFSVVLQAKKSEMIELTVFDAIGRMHYNSIQNSYVGKNEFIIPFHPMAKGIYFIHIRSGSEYYKLKFIKD